MSEGKGVLSPKTQCGEKAPSVSGNKGARLCSSCRQLHAGNDQLLTTVII